MSPVEIESTILVGEWPQTYALDRVVPGKGIIIYITQQKL